MKLKHEQCKKVCQSCTSDAVCTWGISETAPRAAEPNNIMGSSPRYLEIVPSHLEACVHSQTQKLPHKLPHAVASRCIAPHIQLRTVNIRYEEVDEDYGRDDEVDVVWENALHDDVGPDGEA